MHLVENAIVSSGNLVLGNGSDWSAPAWNGVAEC